ncbi:ER membrane protein complex subunit 7-like [Limulus polyphemus]|uniref:ER membrane protein complex subunit 7-like n=1 Tax=Limulus polyphemus TaxID=6850 RepID=A0ABM1BNX8_LIMPO|nr:ER membrane protein complex subunit 7-like [Limulus polyphemus]
MNEHYIIAVLLIVQTSLVNIAQADEDLIGDTYSIDGKVVPPDSASSEWLVNTRILVNGGEHVGFLRNDGSFVVNNLLPGSYVVEVANPNYIYEPARVDINSKGKFRARKVNYIQSSLVHQISYPLKLKSRGPFKYFQVRESWRVTDFLMNPMVLMMVLPLLLVMVLPKMMNAADPETQREMQQLQMPKYDMPELSEMMTSLFTGGKKPQPKSSKVSKKRQ